MYTFSMKDNKCVIEIDSDQSKSPFNYADYERSLEKVLEQAQRDFWCQYIDINRHQIIVGRNYLWVSVAIIGALSALYIRFGTQISFDSALGISFIVGYVSSVIGFGVSLYSMPSKDGYHMPHDGNWSKLTAQAHEQLKNKEKNSYPNFLSDLITKTDNANHQNLITNGRRAKLFRWVYRCLVLSFTASLLSAAIYISTTNNSGIQNTNSETVITKENDMDNDNNSDSSTDNTDQPEVKPPQQPDTDTRSDSRRFVDHVELEKENGLKILNEKK